MVGPINADHLVRVILFGVNAVTLALLCPHSSMKTFSSNVKTPSSAEMIIRPPLRYLSDHSIREPS